MNEKDLPATRLSYSKSSKRERMSYSNSSKRKMSYSKTSKREMMSYQRSAELGKKGERSEPLGFPTPLAELRDFAR